MDEFDFGDLAPKEFHFKAAGKRFVLREPSGDAAVKYRNAVMKSTKFTAEGKPTGIDGLADAEPLLVALCLFEKVADKNGNEMFSPVSVTFVRAWPAWLQKKLFAKSQEMGDLLEKETQEVLERRFRDTTRTLVGLSDDMDEKAKWQSWMADIVDASIRDVEPSKNGTGAMTVGSV